MAEMLPEEELLLLFTTALPINSMSEILYPGASTVLVWVDLTDRSDLEILAVQGDLNKDKLFICTWFYVMPSTPLMGVGLRIKMHESPHISLSLVFPLEHYYDQLVTMSAEGSLWILPEPAPLNLASMLVGNDVAGFFERVAAHCGQGLFVELSPDLIEELRKQLASWSEQYRREERPRAKPRGKTTRQPGHKKRRRST